MCRMSRGPKILGMTFPIVTEIRARLLPVEHDDFIDQFEVPVPAPLVLPLERPDVAQPALRRAA